MCSVLCMYDRGKGPKWMRDQVDQELYQPCMRIMCSVICVSALPIMCSSLSCAVCSVCQPCMCSCSVLCMPALGPACFAGGLHEECITTPAPRLCRTLVILCICGSFLRSVSVSPLLGRVPRYVHIEAQHLLSSLQRQRCREETEPIMGVELWV